MPVLHPPCPPPPLLSPIQPPVIHPVSPHIASHPTHKVGSPPLLYNCYESDNSENGEYVTLFLWHCMWSCRVQDICKRLFQFGTLLILSCISTPFLSFLSCSVSFNHKYNVTRHVYVCKVFFQSRKKLLRFRTHVNVKYVRTYTLTLPLNYAWLPYFDITNLRFTT